MRQGNLSSVARGRAVAALVGLFGAVPLMLWVGAGSLLGPAVSAEAAFAFAATALSGIAARSRVPGLLASALEPRHLGASALLASAALLIGAATPSGGGTLGVVLAAATASFAWSLWHRAVFVCERTDDLPPALPLALVSLLGGAPMALWALPLLTDGPVVFERIVWSSASRFQRIVVTEEAGVLRLFLDGHLQLSSDDERAYHETLVHPALSLVAAPRSALVLGGGDGLVVRELLAYPTLARIVVVDLDAAVTSLAREVPRMARIGGASLASSRVTLVHEDALRFLARPGERFDAIVVDLPDPTSEVLAPLFAAETFLRMRARLAPCGVLSVQAGSPRFSREAFSCIAQTIAATGLSLRAGAVDEPRSFGGTAVIVAAEGQCPVPATLGVAARWLTHERLRSMFAPGPDVELVEVDVSTLARPAVLGYLRAAAERHGSAA